MQHGPVRDGHAAVILHRRLQPEVVPLGPVRGDGGLGQLGRQGDHVDVRAEDDAGWRHLHLRGQLLTLLRQNPQGDRSEKDENKNGDYALFHISLLLSVIIY